MNKEKIYQIIMQDEYNNLYHIGFYKELKKALPDINEWLKIYNVSIDTLETYPSTFNEVFDREIETEDETIVYIRGFILDSKEVLQND